MRVIAGTLSQRACVERAVGALEIGGFGVAVSVGAFMIGLRDTVVLAAIYSLTVAAAYAFVACLERLQPLPQPGND